MKFLKTFVLGAIVASGTLFAALSPEAQTAKEIAAIEQHEEFAKFAELEAGVAPSIMKTEDGYLVQLLHHKMPVHVEYMLEHKACCGPAQFELQFGPTQTMEIPEGNEVIVQ